MNLRSKGRYGMGSYFRNFGASSRQGVSTRKNSSQPPQSLFIGDHLANLFRRPAMSSDATLSAEFLLQEGTAPGRRGRFQHGEGAKRVIARFRKLLRRWLVLSLMGVGLSSPPSLAAIVKLDGTSGSNQNSTPINTGSGTELQNGFFVDYLVVGGGGSGGTSNSSNQATGGGGGGGFREGNMELSASSHNVTVGAGGTSPFAISGSVQGNNGGNSVFGAVTAAGGGGGGKHTSAGSSGGSGGGGGSGSTFGPSGGTAQAGLGNNGGSGGISGATGGGGGGAGAAGASPSPFPSSAVGGAGKVSSITGVAVTYAGGGGGGNTTHSAAFGGAGGGGNGGVGLQAQSGTNGLGGGGGGGGNTMGGNGGSGVVIVRYQGESLGAIGGSVTTGSGFTVHQFSTVGNSSFDMSGVDMNARLGVVQNGVISGAGDLSFSGPGQLTLNAANTHSGITRAIAGTLNLGHANALEYSTLDMNSADNGTVALTQSGQTYNVAGLQGSRDLAIGSNTLSVGANNNSTTYSGNLSGTGAVSKVGTGTFDLSGANAYTGATDVAAGTLLINGSTAGGAVTVQSSASLGGSGTVGGATTFLNGSIHTPGNSAGLQTFTSGLTYNTGSTFQWELMGNTSSGRGSIFDAVDVSGGAFLLQSGVTSSLVFNATSSTVDWTDAFWGSSQSWLVFSSVAGILSGPSIFDTITASNDRNGASLSAVRSGSFFSWSQSGNNLLLNYNLSGGGGGGGGGGGAVPEPTSMAIFGLGALGMAYRARRKSKK